MSRILVIRGGAIGDFILTLPAMRLLREAFPRRASRNSRLQTHRRARGDERLRRTPRARSNTAGSRVSSPAAANCAPELVEYFGGFQQVVSYLFDPDEIFASEPAARRRAQLDRRLAENHRPGTCRAATGAAARTARALSRRSGAQSCPPGEHASDVDREPARASSRKRKRNEKLADRALRSRSRGAGSRLTKSERCCSSAEKRMKRGCHDLRARIA